MSIKEFVANLSMDQLNFCAEQVDARLRTLKEGEKVCLWCVSVDGMYRFTSPNSQEALEWLQSFASHRIAAAKMDRIRVDPMWVYPSEVAGWLEVNDKPEDV
ncbi:hypothetical protein ABE501_18485 [Comamonas testosteroni]